MPVCVCKSLYFVLMHVLVLAQQHKLTFSLVIERFAHISKANTDSLVDCLLSASLCQLLTHRACLQVQSKIHYLSHGSEMSGVGRVLLQHFRTQGTPVMIGMHMCICVYLCLYVCIYIGMYECVCVCVCAYVNRYV